MDSSLRNAGAELRRVLDGNLELIEALDISVNGTVVFFRRDLHRDFAGLRRRVMEELDNIWYDSCLGSQQLWGTVWLTDGTWLSRGEYDGSEWWRRNVYPPIPSKSRWSR